MKLIIILIILAVIVGAVYGAAWLAQRRALSNLRRMYRPDPELEEMRRTLYELTVHDDMIPTVPQELRDRIDRQLGGPTNKEK